MSPSHFVPLGLLDKLAFVLERLGPSLGYNFFLRLHGPLDPDRLAESVVACFEAHPVLKARVVRRRVRFVFDVSHRPGLIQPSEVFSLLEAASGREEHEALTTFVNEPLDVLAGPQLRVLLVRISERDHWLGLKMSHTVCDGVSAIVLSRTLATGYAGVRACGRLEARGVRRVLGDIPWRQYREWLETRVRGRSAAWPPAGEPRPYLIQDISGYGGGRSDLRLGFEVLALTERELCLLETAASSLGVKPLEAAVACLLRALHGDNTRRGGVRGGSYRVGIPIDLRPLAGLSMELGNFSSTLPLRVPAAEMVDSIRLARFVAESLRREKARGTAILGLSRYAILSPFTGSVIAWLSRKGPLPTPSFLQELPVTYSGPLHKYLLPFQEAEITDVLGTFQLIPLFMHFDRRLNLVWPFVDDGRLSRADIRKLFADLRAEIDVLASDAEAHVLHRTKK